MQIKPNDPYSKDWLLYWAANPNMPRGVGADAVEGEGAGAEGDGAGKAGEGEGEGDGKGKVADEGKGDLGKDDLKAASQLLDGDPWADIPDDLKDTAKRFTSKADAIRAIVDLRKRDSQVRVPGAKATPEEKAAYAKAIGIPEKAELYEFDNIPDVEVTDQLKAERNEWSKQFHALGVPKETAKALSKFANELALKQAQATVEADKAFAQKQEDALRSEWRGDEFDRNQTLAKRAFTDIANRAGLNLEDLTKIETKDGRFLMDRAELVKIFAVIGREMSEGSIGPTLTETEKDTLDDQIREVRGQITEAQNNGDSKRANTLYQKEQSLLAKKDGNQAIVGSRGRMV